MSKIERYTGNLQAFGSAAQGAERTLFGETSQANDLTSQVTSSFLRGWGIVGPSENPSMEDFNAAMYTMSQFIAYQHQMGIPEWDALQEYYSGSICVRNGEAYLSLVDSNIGSAPPSAKWTSVLTAKNALANISGFLKSSNNLSDLANAQTALTNLGLTGIGIGLPTQTDIANFDWQNFVFTSGANYVTSYSTWINPPAGVTYNAGTQVSIRVAYISTGGSRVGLEITPDTTSSTNFKVYKLLCTGAPGSRVFTFNQDWNSANKIPASGIDVATNAEVAAGTVDKLVNVPGLMSLFSKRSFTTADYIRIPDVPGGLIIQFGYVGPYLVNTASSTLATITMPTPFPTAFLCGVTGVNGGLPGSLSSTIDRPTGSAPFSSFTQRFANTRTDQGVYSYWLTIGY
ncbi:gp53-like domain-containing protein [Yersinia enterocolitica]|uniref:gp53-like domain-containing protein n=1 Tax=Yersinia enterocolitica TaxID=630 RepID=UPI003F474B57